MWKKKFPKYKNQKVTNHGYSCASKLESAVLSILKSREAAGEIKDLRVQVRIPLTKANIVYVVDFSYVLSETGETEYCESKGFETDVWKIKKRLYKFYGPGKLIIYTGSYKDPRITETINPEE